MTTFIREDASPSPLALPSLIHRPLVVKPYHQLKGIAMKTISPRVVKFTAQTASSETGHQTITRFELSMSAMGIFRQLTRGTNKSGTPARKEAGLRD
jgi:hypothetical protein